MCFLFSFRRLDAFVYEYITIEYEASTRRKCDLKVIGSPFVESSFAIALPKNSPLTSKISPKLIYYKEYSIESKLRNNCRVKLKQMYRQNIRDVPTNHIKNVMFYSWMKTTAYLRKWSPRGSGAVYMEMSYCRVTRLAGLNKHSVHMTPSYTRQARSICFEMGNLNPPNYRIV